MQITRATTNNLKWVEEISSFHQYVTDGGKNIKYVSFDGHFEVIYNGKNVLQNEKNNSLDMGTYNYYSPKTAPIDHGIYDIMPYERWGNVEGK